MNRRILVIEDEVNIQELLKYNLEKNGYLVTIVGNGIDGLEEATANIPDLIILDLMLPGLDGLEICKRLRMQKRTKRVPIFMLTAKSEELDKILGLELGADDYITKPFSIKELIARIRAAMRRLDDESSVGSDEVEKNKILKARDIEIDREKYEVRKNNEKISMTLKEFELLKILVENKGKVLTRDFLLDRIWGYEYMGDTRTVDVHIRHVRQKLNNDEGSGQMIETIRGVGYRFISEGER
ncbi:MAG TPA: response regulator transcription factor [Bacillota bacterium]|nr:response regulator transcription factor [Bacillota bacterium]